MCLIISSLIGSACVKRVTVPQLLPINEPVSTEELVSRINAFEKVKTFAAQGLFDVRSYYTGVGGKADDFPAANGIIRLQRPENIRVKIRVPSKTT